MANRLIILGFSLILAASGCTSLQKPVLSEAETLKAKGFLGVISSMNANSPDTIQSSFSADGNADGKKFKVEGRITFDKSGYYKVTIVDYVFQSPVVEAFRELDRLYFYYPAENKLLTDDVNKIDLTNYTGFRTDYNLIYMLLSGGIPVIDRYIIRNCLYDETARGYNLILENSDFYENIFFKDDIPEKIMVIHKLSRYKAEVYLKSAIKKDSSVFFRSYKIAAPDLNIGININFTKPVINGKVTVERLKRERLPKNTEVIKVN